MPERTPKQFAQIQHKR